MSNDSLKILFLHGLDSSKDSSKFHALNYDQKYCINMDYRNLGYHTVAALYHESIEKIRPDLLVGHSLGGYWALKMSAQHQLPCVIANPSLSPHFRSDYPAITEHDLQHDIPQWAYIELADELLNMAATQEFLENFMHVHAVSGGHHRLEKPETVNVLIDELAKQLR